MSEPGKYKRYRHMTPTERTEIVAESAVMSSGKVARHHGFLPNTVRKHLAEARRRDPEAYLDLRKEVKAQAIDGCLTLLFSGLEATTPEELAALKPIKRVAAMRDLASIYRNLEGQPEAGPSVSLTVSLPARQTTDAWQAEAQAKLALPAAQDAAN